MIFTAALPGTAAAPLRVRIESRNEPRTETRQRNKTSDLVRARTSRSARAYTMRTFPCAGKPSQRPHHAHAPDALHPSSPDPLLRIRKRFAERYPDCTTSKDAPAMRK